MAQNCAFRRILLAYSLRQPLCSRTASNTGPKCGLLFEKCPRRHLYCSGSLLKGSSHWQNVVKTKTAKDGERAKNISKALLRIKTAVMAGGNDANPKTNRRLADVLAECQKENIPKETMLRTVARLQNASNERFSISLIGPSGTMFILQGSGESRAKFAMLLRRAMRKSSIPLPFSVADQGLAAHFEEKAVITIGPPNSQDVSSPIEFSLEDAETLAIEVEAESVDAINDEGASPEYELLFEATRLEKARSQLTELGYQVLNAERLFRPLRRLRLTEENQQIVAHFYQIIEPFEEIENVCDNIEPIGE